MPSIRVVGSLKYFHSLSVVVCDCACLLARPNHGCSQRSIVTTGSYHEIAAQFKAVGGAAFDFMLPVLAGYIAYSIAEKRQVWYQSFRGWCYCFKWCSLWWCSFASVVKTSPLALAGVSSSFLGALVGGFLAVVLSLFFINSWQVFHVPLKNPFYHLATSRCICYWFS